MLLHVHGILHYGMHAPVLAPRWAQELRDVLAEANLMPEERYFWQPKTGDALDRLIARHREYYRMAVCLPFFIWG
jgi:hypothetical protein